MKHISIERNQQEKNSFEILQEESISQLQELSGNIWTDYNLHDPGVTILEQMNYALWELDYRLNFDLQDYFTSGETFDPRKSMMYSPEEVFTTIPVTPIDYRLLILSSIEDVSDVKVIVNKDACSYDFVLDTYSNTLDSHKQDIVARVEQLFHANRNLCEILNKVVFSQSIELLLHANVEINMETYAERLLADIYYQTQIFLSSGASYISVDEEMNRGKMVDELYDGPSQRKLIDPSSLTNQDGCFVISDLYSVVNKIDGVKRVSNLFFSDGKRRYVDKLYVPDFYHSYVIKSFDEDLNSICLWRNGQRVPVDVDEVYKLLQNYRYMKMDSPNFSAQDKENGTLLTGVDHGKLQHTPLSDGLPDCYGVNGRAISINRSTTSTMDDAGQLKVYLSWFDDFFEEVLDKLNNIHSLLNGEYGIASGWIDMIESLYGEYSKLGGVNFHGTRKPDARLTFAKYLASYGKERGKAMNLLEPSFDKCSGVENYLKLLLGIDEQKFDFFIVEHPLLSYSQSMEIPEEDKFTISVIFFASDELLQDKHFCNCCFFLLKKRIPAHIAVRYIKWFPISTRNAFKADFDFWKYMLSTQRKLGADVLSAKLLEWLKK
ncbi:MAG: hypothetical protein VZQ98_06250 [Bacteroidales bacterium]|nr:hypothetical protein [Bacteroidales bacterium]